MWEIEDIRHVLLNSFLKGFILNTCVCGKSSGDLSLFSAFNLLTAGAAYIRVFIFY